MLKPQIWVGQGSWPGDIDMDSEEAWDGWFKRYSEWILNYALLAQAEGVQSLCIGTELRYTTLKQPERWRKLIRAIRSVYSGKLTYAANWGDEFEQLSFWDDLDYIGLNSYYPLSKKEVVTDQELLQGARNWVIMANEVAKQHAKQWWLTEVGYRSVSQAWINPHANPDDRNADLETQSRCYRALFTALTEKADQLTGVYVWKWPSYLDHGYRRGRGEVGFTPNAKPAISVLGDYYERQ